MASIAQLVSEFAHSLKQPNNQALRENLKSLIIHTRAEIIRRSYENHSYIDKYLVQRFRVKLIDVPDGDIQLPKIIKYGDNDEIIYENIPGVKWIKRTKFKVPTAVRLTNNLPFDRVSSVGYNNNIVIPFIKESNTQFRKYLPGMSNIPSYDYINGFIYIYSPNDTIFNLEQIVIESAFEHPTPIQVQNKEVDSWTAYIDENEYLLSEDMIGQIKDIIYKRDLLNTVRETNEVPNTTKYQ